MPLALLRRSLRKGVLRFEKFGELDYGLMSLPYRYTAFVDYDSKEEVRGIPEVYSLARVIGLLPTSVCYKKTRRGWHLAVTFAEKFTDVELIAIQAMLGDDSFRVSLNFMRYWQSKGKKVPEFWKKRSNILYRKKL